MKLFIAKIVIALNALATAAICAEAHAKPIRLIFIQGLNSCAHYYDEPINKFQKFTASHPDAKVYWGCFDGGIIEHPLDLKEHFYVRTLDKNGWSSAQELDPQTAPLEMYRMLVEEVKNINPNIFKIEPSSDLPAAMNLFIAGHSHGGWMAMRFASLFRDVPAFEVQQLLTIDPISYTLCASKYIPTSFFATSISRIGNSNHDCLRAPRDLEPIGRYINEATHNRWTQFYQPMMTYISSGPILDATTNIMPDDTTSDDWYWAHSSIMKDPKGWRYFLSRMEDVATRQ